MELSQDVYWFLILLSAVCLICVHYMHATVVKGYFGGFHLYLSELAFINQFYSIMTRLVRLSLAND